MAKDRPTKYNMALKPTRATTKMPSYPTLDQVYKKVGLTPETDEADVVKDVYDMLMWTCIRCGYPWPKTPGITPNTCASKKCKTPLWNKPRVRNVSP